ncbi:MAG: PDZ domain-containing protein [Pirellulaceae bacterium]
MNTRWFVSAAIVALCSLEIPALWGQEAMDQLERSLDMPLEGPVAATAAKASAGYLGMSVDLTAPDGSAVFVVSVAEGGPAQRAGLQADDILVAVNGVPIRSLDDMGRAVHKPVGTKLAIEVRRGATSQHLEVTLGERAGVEAGPGTELPAPPAAPAEAPTIVEGTRPSLGITVADVTELTRRRFGVTVNSGAVITQIRQGSPAARAGLPLGGVIVSVNGNRIKSANAIVEIIQAFRPGDEVELTYFEGERMGHKNVRLAPDAPTAAASPKSVTSGVAPADRTDPPLRLGRRRVPGRPLLEALERTLDAVLPPEDAAGSDPGPVIPPLPPGRAIDESGDDTLPPPPPPPLPEPPKDVVDDKATEMAVEPPPPPLPGKLPAGESSQSVLVPADKLPRAAADEELIKLRRQVDTLKQQLEQLQRQIDELERRKRGS